MVAPKLALRCPILTDPYRLGETWRRLPVAFLLLLPFMASLHALTATANQDQPVQPLATARNPIVAKWSEVQDLRDRGEVELAVRHSQRALHDHPTSIALLIQQAELRLARGGPGRAFAWVDSLENAGDTRSGSIGRLALASVDRSEADAATTAYALRQEVASGSFDALFLSYHHAANKYQSRSSLPEQSDVDSLRQWADAHPLVRDEQGTAAMWVRSAYALLPALANLAQRRHQNALRLAREARDQSARRGMTTLELRQSTLAGVSSVRAGLANEGVVDLERALRLAVQLGDRHEESVALSFLAYCHERRRDTAKALARYAEANHLLRQLGNERGLGWTLMGEGWIRWLRGEINLAEEILHEGYEVFEAVGDHLGQARALLNLGVVYASTERPDDALRAYERGLELATKSGSPAERGRLLNNIANVHLLNGHAERSLSLYLESLEIARQSGNVEEIARVLGNLALVTDSLDRTEQSLAFSEEAIGEAERAGNRALEAHLLGQQATRLMRMERLERAEENLRRAFAVAGELDDWLVRGELHEIEGRLALLRQDWSASAEAFRSADSLFSKHNHVAGRIRLMYELAWAVAETGDLPSAMQLAREGERLAELRHELGRKAVSRGLVAQLELLFGDPQRGWDACRAAMQTAIEARLETRALQSGEGGPGWHRPQATATSQLGIFMRLADATGVLTDPAKMQEAFNILQNLKARTLLELVEPRRAYIQPAASDSLLDTLRARRLQLSRNYERLLNARSDSERDSLRRAHAHTLARYDEALTRVMESDPRYARAHRREVLELQHMRPHFVQSRGALILDFLVPPMHRFDPDIEAYLFAFDEHGLTVHPIGRVTDLAEQVRFYLDLVQESPASAPVTGGIRSASEALYARLLGPVEERIRECEELIIAPDGAVHLVPFAALLHLGTSNLTPPPLTITPSLSVLHMLEGRSAREQTRSPRHDIAIWSAESGTSTAGPGESAGAAGTRELPEVVPLRYAADERRALEHHIPATAIFPPPGPGETAREAIIEAGLLGDTRVLHFIAHGVFDDRRPWAGGLQLQLDSAQPFRHHLSATDVYGMNFDTELVTLSACETARGEILVGEGMLGFAQALFGSGAQSVLATLWPVDDASSARFMTRFYEELGAGRAKAEALRNTQATFATDPHVSHPFYWASYVLIGEGSTGVNIRTGGSHLRAILLIGLAVLLAVLALRLRVSSG